MMRVLLAPRYSNSIPVLGHSTGCFLSLNAVLLCAPLLVGSANLCRLFSKAGDMLIEDAGDDIRVRVFTVYSAQSTSRHEGFSTNSGSAKSACC